MKLIKQKIWVEVDVEDELPNQSGIYKVTTYNNNRFDCFYENENDVWQLGSTRIFTKNTGITHWLKPIEDKYVFSKEELFELIRNSIDDFAFHNDFETIGEYLQSLI